MKLYDIPQHSKIRLPIGGEGREDCRLEVCEFYHIDGMYSYIKTESGSVVHLGASTELKLGDDGIYEMV